jgi:hypothetical protein
MPTLRGGKLALPHHLLSMLEIARHFGVSVFLIPRSHLLPENAYLESLWRPSRSQGSKQQQVSHLLTPHA